MTPADDLVNTLNVKQASTILVVRDGPQGMEVLMVRRPTRSGDASSGAFVFPGGKLDAHDFSMEPRCSGRDDASASRRLGLPVQGLAYYVAAIRECFEEAGLLLAYPA